MVSERVAEAVVDVGGDFRRFDRDFDAEMRSLGGRASSQFQKGFGDTGRRAGDAFNKGFDRSTRRSGGAAGGIGGGRGGWGRQGAQAGGEFGRGFRRGLGSALGRRGLFAVLAAPALAPVVAGFGALTTAASGAAAAIAVVGSELAGALSGIPAGIAGIAGGVATLKVAFSGLDEAMKNLRDPEKFNAALKGLAPQAQTVAREIRGLVPEFDQLRRSVQGAMFEPMVGQFDKLASVLTGPLKTGMTGLARQFGLIGKQLVSFASSSPALQAMTAVFEGLQKGFANAAKGLPALLNGPAHAAQAVAPAFAKIGADIGQWLDQLGQGLSNRGAAQLRKDVLDAWAAFKQLFSIARNVATAIGGIGTAFEKAFGTTILAKIEDVTAKLATALSTSKQKPGAIAIPGLESPKMTGQDQLVAFFKNLRVTAQSLTPTFRQLGASIAEVANAILDMSRIAGPGLTPLIKGLGTGLSSLLRGIGQLTKDIGPTLGPLLSTLGHALGELAKGLGPGLGEGLRGISAVIASIDWRDVGTAVGQAASNFGRLLEVVSKVGGPVINGLVDAAGWILRFVRGVGEFGLQVAGQLSKALPNLQAVGAALTGIKDAVGGFFTGLGQKVKAAFITSINWVIDRINEIINTFNALPGPDIAPLRRVGEEAKKSGRELSLMGALGKIAADTLKVAWAGLPAAMTGAGAAAKNSAATILQQINVLKSTVPATVKQAFIGASNEANKGSQTAASAAGRLVVRMRTALAAVPETVSDPVRLGMTRARTQAVVGVARTSAATAVMSARIASAMRGVPSAIADPIRRGFAEAVAAARRGVALVLARIRALQAAAAAARAAASIRFARGGIVDRATPAIVGEAGREVIIPLTKPRRAEELARQSGLLRLLAQRGAVDAAHKGRRGDGGTKTQNVNAPITVVTPSRDPSIVAHKVVSRLGRAIPSGAW